MIRKERGKVYPGAVNNKRTRYAKDLKNGVAHDRNGNVISDPETGVVRELSRHEKSYRAGYSAGCQESTAAAKTAAGLKANEKMPDGVKIVNVAVNTSTNKALTSKQLENLYKVK